MTGEYVYRTQQIGWVLLIGLLGSAGLVVLSGGAGAPRWVLLLVVAPLPLSALALGRLVVEVGGGELRWRYGWLGWPRWRVALAEIAHVEPCHTHDVLGWGIHKTREGWLYNIAGSGALRITRRDGRRFRLGAADVAALQRALEARLAR